MDLNIGQRNSHMMALLASVLALVLALALALVLELEWECWV